MLSIIREILKISSPCSWGNGFVYDDLGIGYPYDRKSYWTDRGFSSWT